MGSPLTGFIVALLCARTEGAGPSPSSDDVLLQRLAEHEKRVAGSEAQYEKRVAELEARLMQLEREHRRPAWQPGDQRMPQQATTSPLGEMLYGDGRRLSQTPSCCRWTANDACSTVAKQCTSLYEYLEHKTSVHEFADVESCLGTDDTAWSWAFDPIAAEVALSQAGSEVARVKTPIKVTHGAGCGATMDLQLNATVPQLTVSQPVQTGALKCKKIALSWCGGAPRQACSI